MNRTARLLSLGIAFHAALAAQPLHLPGEPLRDTGQSITGAFEGWFKNKDGSFSLLVGYFNRNLKQDIDIAIGPENAINPGGPDRGQPTHFAAGRQWGVFVVTVPANFGSGKLTWTITANGQPTTIPLSLSPLWEISPFSETGVGNTPPVITFEPRTAVQGPVGTVGATMTATVGKPLAITVRLADDAKVGPGAIAPATPAATVTWSKFRGPGGVQFTKPVTERLQGSTGPAFQAQTSTSATFSEPGEYTLLVVGNDWSGDGGRGFQCCWTTAQVRVTVR